MRCAAFCLTSNYIHPPAKNCIVRRFLPTVAKSREARGDFRMGRLLPPAPQENTTATLKSGTYHPCLHRVPCIPAGTLSKKSTPAEGVRGRDRMSPPLQPLRRAREDAGNERMRQPLIIFLCRRHTFPPLAAHKAVISYCVLLVKWPGLRGLVY